MADWIQLRVKAVQNETLESKTYTLEPTDGQGLSYEAGQFLTLGLIHEGHEIRRSYSLSSTPGVDTDVKLTIKRVPNGEISRWLLQTLEVGSILNSLPPSGRFTLASPLQEKADIFLLAAGSGITPIFSILKAVLTQQPDRRVVIIYSNTHPRSTIFLAELEKWQELYPNRLFIEHIWSNPGGDAAGRRLNNTLLEKLVNQYHHARWGKPEFYICGPEDYMRMVRIVLIFMGFDAESIRKENFVIPMVTPQVPEGFGVASKVTIHYRQQSHELAVEAGTYILTAALRAGIELPYSCRGGRCSTCVALCQEGRVKMTINDVLTERELAEGEILTCTALAETSEIVIRVE
ncbi:ferredoxin--NADP reductase [Siphonobacter sp. SORGH_AS_1065]|uniref:ferredoxin--NADP reductase n=1 Tax=Siphonobacter sp. SORGH_AS_1065 TaxID=3041795 RepID=UPI0027802529|nr:ferredoxin--NADP reductase [Siphonobacter sp. SORGH_AS_1065]MDQ1086705.1 ferredoxin-NADP reductase [Siphonobacter sp. SORGH_AS_1065]